MRDFKIIAALADLHIGAKQVSAEAMKSQLKIHFFQVLNNLAHLDAIFILGDILHTIVSLNSDYSELFYWFIDKVYKTARKHHATVVIIKGTISHDNNQLDNIKSYIDNMDGVDFRIYDTVEEITLWKDYKVLVLPDVKVKRLKEIDKYLDKPGRYDIILGHGTIEQMQYVAQESENMPTKPYIYDVDKLMAASKGPVLFGHIHQYQTVDQKFYYVGPFTMLERGYSDAGFAIIGIYDKDRTKFKVEHYRNPDSAEYYDICVTRSILDSVPLDEIIEAIDQIANEAKSNDLITLRITRSGEMEASDKVLILETRYRKDRRFSIVKKIKNKNDEQHEQIQKERRKAYAYVMDENLSVSAIAYRYYVNDLRPSFPDKMSLQASLSEEDFNRMFSNQ